METAVAAVHKAAAAVLVDILAVSVVEVVDCQVVPEFLLDRDLVVFGRAVGNVVSVVVERKAQEEGRSDSHTGLAEVVDELAVRIHSLAVAAAEACHILLVGLEVEGHRMPAGLVRRGLFLLGAPARLLLLGRDLRIVRIGRCDDHLVGQTPAAGSCLSADALSTIARQPVHLPRSVAC